jgi:hypothetical protein
MAKTAPASKKQTAPAASAKAETAKKDTKTAVSAVKTRPLFVFGKINYILMLAGIVVLAIGYLLMVGGRSDNPSEFHPEELYSDRRIIVAPIVILIGLAIEVFAIMIKPKD